MNIVEMILKLLSGGDTMSKIASLLGVGPDQAGKAVSAAVPTLLAALAGAASKPEGAASLANVLSKQDHGLLDNLSGFLSGGGAAAPQNTSLLSSLLGSGGSSQIGSVLSRFTGVGEGGTGKLLGLLAPIVLGAIGKQSTGLDAAGIASMLAGQKGNITSALPAGLGSLLSSALPSLSGLVGGASNAASSVGRTATRVTSGAAREAEAAGSSMMKWLIPLILLGLGIFFLPRMCSKVSESARTMKDKADEVVSVAGDSTKLIGSATGLIKDATATIAGITDEASAAAALPKLQGITTQLGGLYPLWAKLPAPVQKTISEALRPLIPRLREAAQPVLSMPVVGDKVRPALEEMLGQLNKLVPAT
jgi:hypothetical protein